MAGLFIAALLLISTGQSGPSPKGPFLLGSTASLRDEIEQSPVYVADPTGGEGLWLALARGRIVALAAVPPGGSSDCTVRWRSSINAYQDCHGKRYRADALATYTTKNHEGSLFVDTRHTNPPAG
jgi:hypothetical protein